MKIVGAFSLILLGMKTPNRTVSATSTNNYGFYYLIRFCLKGLRKLAVYGTKTPYIKN